MTKINCLNPIAACGLNQLTDRYAITDTLAEADAVLVRSAGMHELELPEGLLAIARAGAGVNNIPLEKCAEKGIVVFNTPGANANGVKELVIAAMLLAARDIVGGVNWVRSNENEPDIAKLVEKGKKNFAGTEIMGKKLAVIGLGAIGYRVANAAVSLGMDVYGYDPFLPVQSAWNISHHVNHCDKLEQVLENADYVTIHVPALDSTKGMLNQSAFELMNDGAVILNFARDILVNETDIAAALESGKLAKYVTDFPNPAVMKMKNVIAVPHLGASTEESEDNCAMMAVKEIMEFVENGNIQHSVNYPDCELGAAKKPARITVLHRNKPNVISNFSAIAGDAGINIDDMICKSRGDYSYAIFDLNAKVPDGFIEKTMEIDGVIKVRVIEK